MEMARHPVRPPTDDETAKARSIADAFVGNKKPRSQRSPGFSSSTMKRAKHDADAMMKSGDWDAATAVHFVALYSVLHEKVYGVPPSELVGAACRDAALVAARMLKSQFDGDQGAMANFMRWTWTREKEREAWRRQNQRDGGRIGWRLQFNGAILTDYRIALARKRGT